MCPSQPDAGGSSSGPHTTASSSTPPTSAACHGTLLYMCRRDLRVEDNAALVWANDYASRNRIKHFVPLYIFDARQMEVSGIMSKHVGGRLPPAKHHMSGYWRCGPHRARFIAESVFDFRDGLRALRSDLSIHAGTPLRVIPHIMSVLHAKEVPVRAIVMSQEVDLEALDDEAALVDFCKARGVHLEILNNDRTLIDYAVFRANNVNTTPGAFKDFQDTLSSHDKTLKELARPLLRSPPFGALPSFIEPIDSSFPYSIPEDLSGLVWALVQPVLNVLPACNLANAFNTMPVRFHGGENVAHAQLLNMFRGHNARLVYDFERRCESLASSGHQSEISPYLSLGCLTPAQVMRALADYEAGNNDVLAGAVGYGGGENKGTTVFRWHLLWRDYYFRYALAMRHHLYDLHGIYAAAAAGGQTVVGHASNQHAEASDAWVSAACDAPRGAWPTPREVQQDLDRIMTGMAGISAVDASQRELLYSGFTSKRGRINLANFLARVLRIDWRYGAQWYECMLIDYDPAINWGAWHHIAGIGQDRRGNQLLNPILQGRAHDPWGEYIAYWMPELHVVAHYHRSDAVPAPHAEKPTRYYSLGPAGDSMSNSNNSNGEGNPESIGDESNSSRSSSTAATAGDDAQSVRSIEAVSTASPPSVSASPSPLVFQNSDAMYHPVLTPQAILAMDHHLLYHPLYNDPVCRINTLRNSWDVVWHGRLLKSSERRRRRRTAETAPANGSAMQTTQQSTH